MVIMQKSGFAVPKFSLGLALVVPLMILSCGIARADRGGDSPVTVVPAPGQPNQLRLRTQTVDITLNQGGQDVWADTRVGLQVSNPFTMVITSTLSLPGPQLTKGGLPANLQLKLGDEALPLEPVDPPGSGLTTQLVMPPQSEVALELDYRQALPESGGVITLAYPLAASSQWGRVPESLRLTVSSELPLAPEQILGLVPDPQAARGPILTWNWDTAKAPDVWLAFMSPDWWRRFTEARAAAAAPNAGPAQHLVLSQLYQQLAALPRLSFAPAADFYARYYPLAIAELQAAAESHGQDGTSGPEQTIAHGMLARRYAEQAGRLGRGAGDVYLDLAATEAQAALDGGVRDDGLRTLASDALVQLAATANARGDSALAEAYLTRRARLDPAQGSGALGEQRTARLALAAGEVTRGNLGRAQQIISDTFGAENIDIPALRPPLSNQILVTVETTLEGPVGDPGQPGGAVLTGRRKVAASLVDGGNPAGLATLIGQAADAWHSVPGVAVKSGPDWISVEFEFADERRLAEIQSRMMKLLPNLPELALMTATMLPESMQLQAGQTDFQGRWHYAEAADLSPAVDAWQRRADEVRAGSLRLAPPPPDALTVDPTPEPNATNPTAAQVVTATVGAKADLGELQRAIWDAHAAAWEKLADHSYAQYTVNLGTGGPTRKWQVEPGKQRLLEAERLDWRTDRLLLVAAAGGLVVLLLAVLLWRLL
jgi:hypothetical protein